MGRTISEIYDAIIAEKQTLATLSTLLEDSSSNAVTPYRRLLADVSSSSKVAGWRLWAFIVSVAVWVLENLWDKFRSEINELADQAISGNVPWYLRQVFAFQFGHDLVFLNNKFKYATIDETAKIIERAAIVDADGELRIKVAKLTNGNPAPLSVDEKTGFTSYINKVKFAGTRIMIISEVADDLTFNLTVYYNPLIGIDAVIENTETAVGNYLSNLEFNGAFNTTRFIDSLQSASGIEDIVANSIQARYGALPFADVGRQNIPNSGYFAIIGGLPLSTRTDNPDGTVTTENAQGVTITYVPNV